jgi:hypothetical protein
MERYEARGCAIYCANVLSTIRDLSMALHNTEARVSRAATFYTFEL